MGRRIRLAWVALSLAVASAQLSARVGFSASLTGGSALSGLAMHRAAMLYEELVTAKTTESGIAPDVLLTSVVVDDHSSAAQVIINHHDFIQDGIQLFIGPITSSLTMAAITALDGTPNILLAPAASTCSTVAVRCLVDCP